MSELVFSVVICTHNRSELLADVVDSLRQQDYPPERYEILIVDNASTDDTRQEVERLQRLDGHPVRYVYEPRIGQSYARNTGAQEAQGDVVAYIDDDAIATPGWLAGLTRGFDLDGADMLAVGGGIEVQWEGQRPTWLPRELEGYLGHTGRLGTEMRILDYGVALFGSNIAVRRAVFAEIGGFSVHLGPHGNRLGGYSDDLEFCQRIWRCGGRLVFVPEALVYHRIFPERTTRCYIFRRGLSQGMADIVMTELDQPSPRSRLLLGAGADTFRLANDLWQVARHKLARRDHEAFTQLVYTVSRLGRIRQELKLAATGLPADLEIRPPQLKLEGASHDA